MARKLRLTLAQLNPTVGDLAGNAAKARDAADGIRVEIAGIGGAQGRLRLAVSGLFRGPH